MQPEAMPELQGAARSGLLDEYQIFCDLFGETEELKNRLKEGESVIRRKFQAEKVWKLTSKSTIIDAASAYEGGKYDSTEIDHSWRE